MADWQRSGPEDVYDAQQIEQRLQEELPAWHLDNGWIRRKYKTGGWQGALMVANTVGHLAEAAFHHPNKDFELARMIEQVVMWQPGKAPGALAGTPDDPRFKYIEYDAET